MPQPNGYRKAMRFMRHANKFGLPIVTLVDTPGAYAGKAAEELGQVDEFDRMRRVHFVENPSRICSRNLFRNQLQIFP